MSFWENGVPLPFNDARYSGLSVGVPGTVETWVDALEKFGTMSLAEVLAPAIHVARHGYVIDQVWFDQSEREPRLFDDIPATAALFLDADGTPRDVGTVFTNPALAETYERIAHLGAKGFYRGEVADAIVETVQHPAVGASANHVWRPGVMTMRDLHSYAAVEREPTHVNYRGLDVYSMGPPSSGGSTVGEALNILEGYDLSSMTRAAALHFYLEASRYSFADRNAYLADPAYFEVPARVGCSPKDAATRRALITEPPAAARRGSAPETRTRTRGRPETTTHLTTSDTSGNVVSYTFTIESTGRPRASWSPVSGSCSQRADGLQLRLGRPIQTASREASAHAARWRPRSSQRQAKPFLALGSPGGATIITTVLQILPRSNRPRREAFRRRSLIPRASQRNAVNTGAEPTFLATSGADRARGSRPPLRQRG